MDGSTILANTLGPQDGAMTAVSVEASGDTSLNTEVVSLINGSVIVSSSSGLGRAGDVEIVGEAVSLEGNSIIFTANSDAVPVGGSIIIHANKSLFLSEGSILLSTTSGSSNGGDISISAGDHLTLSGSDGLGNYSQVRTQSDGLPGMSGNGGSINITAGSLTISDPSSISTSSTSTGNAGDIGMSITGEFNLSGGADISSHSGIASGEINIVADRLSMSGHSQFSDTQIVSSNTDAAGITGDIILNVRELSVTDGARIESRGSTNTGSIIIAVSESAAFANGGRAIMQVNSEFGGVPGRVLDLSAQKTISLDQGLLQTFTVGNGDAAAIKLNAENIYLRGSQITSDTRQGSGRGGDVTIVASNQLTISDQFLGVPSTRTAGPAGVSSRTQLGTGEAGNILLKAQTLHISNGALIDSSTSSSARGGNIAIETSVSLNLNDGASISASSFGSGNAGNISINAGQQFDMLNSSIKTESAQASGGNIDIQAIDRVRLVNSSISTSVLGGAGSGGNITIDPNIVVLQNSNVIAQAVQGAGGNITITTPLFLSDQSSLVSASSQFGLNGTVTIQSPASNVSGSLGTLPSNPDQTHSLLTQRCAALVNSQASSFVVAGREQLPADPGGWLTSPLYATGVGEGQGVRGKGLEGLSTNEGREIDTQILSLRRLTPSGFLIANFADSEATGCHA
jgi:large exoprotein involved in heme utilization and adhesion